MTRHIDEKHFTRKRANIRKDSHFNRIYSKQSRAQGTEASLGCGNGATR
jgi:hypothetical protein